MRPPQLIVGVDGSPESGRALEWAADEAARGGREIIVLSTYEWTAVIASTPFEESFMVEAKGHAEALVADGVARVREIAPDAAVNGRVVAGSAAHALVSASADGGTVVVGNRGRGGFSSLLLGSVSQHVALHAHGPVVVVRGEPPPAQRPVVVGVDGSPGSNEALRLAFEQADARASGVATVRVYRPAGPTFSADGSVIVEDPEERQAAERAALVEDVAPWAEKYPEMDIRYVAVQGNARGVLTELSAQACLVVVGNRGHGGLSGLLLGSVGLHLLHHAQCPVLIARAFSG